MGNTKVNNLKQMHYNMEIVQHDLSFLVRLLND